MKLLLMSMVLCLGISASARTWTKVDGSTFDGTFLKVQAKNVRIQVVKVDPIQSIEMAQLSPEDQEFIAQQQKLRAEKKEARASVPADRVADWVADLETAKAEAQKYDLPILLLYTAPSWCGYCKRLDEQLIEQNEFKTYANQNLVLLLADYSDKAEGEKWGEKHKELINSCPINGYPHTYLLSSGAEKLGSVQYYEPAWSIQDYIDKIESLRAKAVAK